MARQSRHRNKNSRCPYGSGPAFKQTFLKFELDLPTEKLDKSGTKDIKIMKKISTIGYKKILLQQLKLNLDKNGIDYSQLSKKELQKYLV